MVDIAAPQGAIGHSARVDIRGVAYDATFWTKEEWEATGRGDDPDAIRLTGGAVMQLSPDVGQILLCGPSMVPADVNPCPACSRAG